MDKTNINTLKSCMYSLRKHAIKQNNLSFKLAELKIYNNSKHILSCFEMDNKDWYLQSLTETLQLISMYELFNENRELAHIKISIQNLFEDLNID